jgi:hypothetical protein
MKSIVKLLRFGRAAKFDTFVGILKDRVCKQLFFHLISYLLSFVKAKRLISDLAMSIQEKQLNNKAI